MRCSFWLKDFPYSLPHCIYRTFCLWKNLVPNRTFVQTEYPTTLTTYKGFFSSMNLLMVKKLRFLIEGFPTFTTFLCAFSLVWRLWYWIRYHNWRPYHIHYTHEVPPLPLPCPRVDYLKISKISSGAECFPALIVLVGLLTSMEDLM